MRATPVISAVLFLVGASSSYAQNSAIRVPTSAEAGRESTIATTGSGKATLYLVGPGISLKNDINMGGETTLRAQDLQNAGAYQVVVCSDNCETATFFVSPAKAVKSTFLVHPSRVPVSQPDAVSGVAITFDQFRNLVLTPENVNFQLTAGNTTLLSRSDRSRDGIAWFRTTSGKSAGALHVTATVNDVSTQRVVQQVASEPCNLHIQGQRDKTGILVQTLPVHDCSGNPVPDGTIVTFTATDSAGKSTVDAPIKQGIARAQITAPGSAVVSVASGVVMGNELRVGAQ